MLESHLTLTGDHHVSLAQGLGTPTLGIMLERYYPALLWMKFFYITFLTLLFVLTYLKCREDKHICWSIPQMPLNS